MKKILTAILAVAIALAPPSAIGQGVITGQQSYVTGSKPDAKPGKYKVVKIKKAKAVHHKHSYKVAKAPHYARHSYYRPGHHHHHSHGHHHWLLPALVATAVGLGLFRFWH
jgi:predicted homoserine dehydrogenase-like protein